MSDGLLKNWDKSKSPAAMDDAAAAAAAAAVAEDARAQVSHFAALPIEIFLHICSFLDVRDMAESLSRVCRRFHQILEDENMWRAWIAKRWNAQYPVVPVADNELFDWKGACLDLERHWKTWSRSKDTFAYANASDVHISSTDAIVFLDSPAICVSASRDRSIVVWSPLKRNNARPLHFQKNVAHEGWIWRLHYLNDVLYSCSWDNTIKTWDVSSDALHNISTFRCTSPVLSMASLDGLLIAGDFSKTIYGFDPRSKPEPQFTYSAHHGAVLTLGTFKNYIISGSEDKTLAVWDSRNRKLKQRTLLGKLCYPNCSYIDAGILYVGDNRGKLHVFNLRCGNASLVKCIDSGHQKTISSIKHNRGYLLTSSLDGSIRISIPSNPPKGITTVTSNGGEVGCMDYYDGILAAGSTELVEFWISKEYSDVH